MGCAKSRRNQAGRSGPLRGRIARRSQHLLATAGVRNQSARHLHLWKACEPKAVAGHSCLTDEVYGSLDAPLEADENFPLQPSSRTRHPRPDRTCWRWAISRLQMPVMVTRASNNYGPYSFPKKLIPLMISNALETNRCGLWRRDAVRDWLYC